MIGFVVGLRAEARLLLPLGSGVLVGISGATASGAREAVSRLLLGGASHLVSLGLAAGLDPAMRPGAVVVPSRIVAFGRDYPTDPLLCARLGGVTAGGLLHSDVVVATVAGKRALYSGSLCVALDMESGIMARAASEAGLPFAALRAICDPASRDLPHAARVALKPDGGIATVPLLVSLLRRPGQLPALIGLGRDASAARRALVRQIASIRI